MAKNLASIDVLGARVHNLKDIDVSIPRDQLVVITGLSGSGKSSLAFDTIYAEGQRRYIETFSAYARQFLGSLDAVAGTGKNIHIECSYCKDIGSRKVGSIGSICWHCRDITDRRINIS